MTYDPSQYAPRRRYGLVSYHMRRIRRWWRMMRPTMSAQAIILTAAVLVLIVTLLVLLTGYVSPESTGLIRSAAFYIVIVCTLTAGGFLILRFFE